MLLVVIGTRPFGLHETSSIAGTAAVVLAVVVLAFSCFARGPSARARRRIGDLVAGAPTRRRTERD
jgi:hypothetical protein